MSALAHYLEAAGIPTTLVALVREHAEAIKPPRALAVPFELGRPLGAPEDAAFQRRVIDDALALLDRTDAPVLTDFADDAPPDNAATADADEGWACPVSFAQPAAEAPATHAARIAAEIGQLKPWHEAHKRRRGATGFGLTGLEPEALADFLGGYADGADAISPMEGVAVADAFKLAVNDVMTFYQEAANAQPGAAGSSAEVNAWFWGDTAAGKALAAARARGGGDDKRLGFVIDRLTVPHVAEAVVSGE